MHNDVNNHRVHVMHKAATTHACTNLVYIIHHRNQHTQKETTSNDRTAMKEKQTHKV